jgi:hypothetical protein
MMEKRVGGLLALITVALASCGRPDASGIYLAKSDHQAAMIQLVQGKDGIIGGRVEVASIGPGGVLNDQSNPLEGAASKHDLVLKPAGAWFGGLGVSGRFSGDTLTLSGNGSQVMAHKASLDQFQKALTHLKAQADIERRRAAEAQATPAAEAAEAGDLEGAGDKTARLRQAALDLRADAARLDAGVAAAPDYARQSAENTAKVARMLQTAPGLSRLDRGRLSGSANGVAIATNQIEIARYQYALRLNPIVQHSSPTATAVQRFCDTPAAAPVSARCAEANAAATEFQSAVVHASSVLKEQKQAVQRDETQQNEMARKIGG